MAGTRTPGAGGPPDPVRQDAAGLGEVGVLDPGARRRATPTSGQDRWLDLGRAGGSSSPDTHAGLDPQGRRRHPGLLGVAELPAPHPAPAGRLRRSGGAGRPPVLLDEGQMGPDDDPAARTGLVGTRQSRAGPPGGRRGRLAEESVQPAAGRGGEEAFEAAGVVRDTPEAGIEGDQAVPAANMPNQPVLTGVCVASGPRARGARDRAAAS